MNQLAKINEAYSLHEEYASALKLRKEKKTQSELIALAESKIIANENHAPAQGISSGTTPSFLLGSILHESIALNASDIHIEARRGHAKVRVRVDGQLSELFKISKTTAVELSQFCFNNSNRKVKHSWSEGAILNSALEYSLSDTEQVSLRLSSIPELRGFDLVIRILGRNTKQLHTLESIGYSQKHIEMLKRSFARPYGLIVFSGPTGSGKSTSMLAVLSKIASNRKIVSLEYPVETTLENISHVGEVSITPRSLACELNRWDTNINVLGELRDAETASAICDMNTSGKLVITTLHAASAIQVPLRLAMLGITSELLSMPGFLALIVNQRLIPKLCTVCNFEQDVQKAHTECQNCRGTRYSGRVLVAEMIEISTTDRRYLQRMKINDWSSYLLLNKWQSMQLQVKTLVRKGIVSQQDAERYVGSSL